MGSKEAIRRVIDVPVWLRYLPCYVDNYFQRYLHWSPASLSCNIFLFLDCTYDILILIRFPDLIAMRSWDRPRGHEHKTQ